jgi:hypothetical protein
MSAEFRAPNSPSSPPSVLRYSNRTPRPTCASIPSARPAPAVPSLSAQSPTPGSNSRPSCFELGGEKMANRYLPHYQCFADTSSSVSAIVPNPMNPWPLRPIQGENSVPPPPLFLPSLKTSCYPSYYQRVEDAAVNERRARRWPSNVCRDSPTCESFPPRE